MINVYKAIPDQSNAHFTLENSIIPDIDGEFSCLSGTFTFDPEDLNKCHIEAFIDVKTIDTKNETRDKALKSEAVFNAKKYPTIRFESSAFIDNGLGVLEVEGNLTVKNITKKAILHVERPESESQKISLTANTVINREKFKLQLGSILEIGEILVGDNIEFEMDIQLIREQAHS